MFVPGSEAVASMPVWGIVVMAVLGVLLVIATGFACRRHRMGLLRYNQTHDSEMYDMEDGQMEMKSSATPSYAARPGAGEGEMGQLFGDTDDTNETNEL
jgi:hypothetical protein